MTLYAIFLLMTVASMVGSLVGLLIATRINVKQRLDKFDALYRQLENELQRSQIFEAKVYLLEKQVKEMRPKRKYVKKESSLKKNKEVKETAH